MSGTNIEKQDDKLPDYLGKVYLLQDNLLNILNLSDHYFKLLQQSLNTNLDFKKNSPGEKVVLEKTTAMLFQLSVVHLFNLTEVMKFLKQNFRCQKIFQDNKIYDKFNADTRLICELRNHIVAHGNMSAKYLRGLQHVSDDLKISIERLFKNIWISLRCGLELTQEILFEFKDISTEQNKIAPSMYYEEEIDKIEIYCNAKNKYNELRFPESNAN